MSDDPLIAPVNPRPGYEGAYSLESMISLMLKIKAEGAEAAGWDIAGYAVFDSGLIDPIGTAVANGIGWVLDHMEPLSSWLNDFAGEHEQVFAFSSTWSNISAELATLAEDTASGISDLDELEGLTVEAYRTHASTLADTLGTASELTAAVAEALQSAALLVKTVHQLVRDTIGAIIGGLVTSGIIALATAGAGAALTPEIVTAKVAMHVARISPRLAEAVRILARIATSLDQIAPALSKALAWLRRFLGLSKPKPVVPPRRLITLTPGELPRSGPASRGLTDGGPGTWAKTPVRSKGAAYQEFITKMKRGTEYNVEGVDFDGYDPARDVLLDAKDWKGFPPLDEDFWHAKTLKEIRGQLAASGDMRIEWHFSTQAAKDAVDELLDEYGMAGAIDTVFTPFG